MSELESLPVKHVRLKHLNFWTPVEVKSTKALPERWIKIYDYFCREEIGDISVKNTSVLRGFYVN